MNTDTETTSTLTGSTPSDHLLSCGTPVPRSFVRRVTSNQTLIIPRWLAHHLNLQTIEDPS